MATKIRINFLSLKNENWWILHKFYTIKFFIPFLHFDRKKIFLKMIHSKFLSRFNMAFC